MACCNPLLNMDEETALHRMRALFHAVYTLATDGGQEELDAICALAILGEGIAQDQLKTNGQEEEGVSN